MAIKTFTTGEVLTASDTNTYLNDAGLVLITSGITVSSVGGSAAATVSNGTITIGTANTSVTVSGAFSATYDNYLVQLSGGAASGDTNLGFQLGSKTTNYKTQLIYASWNNTIAAEGSSTGTNVKYVASAGANGMQGLIQVINPFLSKNTFVSGNWISTGDTGFATGQTGDTTSYSAFTIVVGAGSITGGTIRVYGYRKP